MCEFCIILLHNTNVPCTTHNTNVLCVVHENKLLTWGDINLNPSKCNISIPINCLESSVVLNLAYLRYVSIGDKVYVLKTNQNQYLEINDLSPFSILQEIEILDNVIPIYPNLIPNTP